MFWWLLYWLTTLAGRPPEGLVPTKAISYCYTTLEERESIRHCAMLTALVLVASVLADCSVGRPPGENLVLMLWRYSQGCGVYPTRMHSRGKAMPSCLSVCLSVCPSLCLSVCLSVCLSICLCVCLSTKKILKNVQAG